MKKRILIRFGDMMLKGQNIGFFIKRVRQHITFRLSDLDVSYVLRHDRMMIDYQVEDEIVIVERLKMIPGIYDFSITEVCEPDLDAIIKTAIILLDNEITKDDVRLKIDTRRTDKTFPGTRLEITQKVAKPIIEGTRWKIQVDLTHPDVVLNIDIRLEGAYLFLNRIKGMGGYPFGTGGRGLVMMSGGIDSSVASYLAIKQGVEVELLHFESSPLTPLESIQKVIDLAKVLAKYTLTGKIKLYVVPFTKLHHEIIDHVFEPYMITVMRRMMYRIAEEFAKKKKLYVLINGESIGQVASQTLHSMNVVESVTRIPIIRPLVTYDKISIIQIAKEIQTYDISIRPFNDCCSIYVPKQPVTKPMDIYASKYEDVIDYKPLIEEAIREIKSITIDHNSVLDLTQYGFTFEEAFEHYTKEKSDVIDHVETK